MNPDRRSWLLVSALLVSLVGGACGEARMGEAGSEVVVDPARTESRPTSEPEPPDWFQITPVSQDLPEGATAFDVEIRPEADADVELEIVPPGRLRFASGVPRQRYQMRRDGPPVRARVSMPGLGTPGTSVTVRLRVLDGAGNPTMVVDRSVTFGPRPTAPAGVERVPVVLTRPDGSRIVQHMTRAEAQRQGLTVADAGPALQGAPAAPPEETDAPPDAGGDRRPETPAR